MLFLNTSLHVVTYLSSFRLSTSTTHAQKRDKSTRWRAQEDTFKSDRSIRAKTVGKSKFSKKKLPFLSEKSQV